MKFLLYFAILFLLQIASAADTSQDELSDQFEVIQMRKLGMSEGAVSDATTKAAYDVFSRYSFLFKSSEEVITLLGKPSETSKSDSNHVTILIYRFDSGYGGWEYRLSFRAKKVFRVEAIAID